MYRAIHIPQSSFIPRLAAALVIAALLTLVGVVRPVDAQSGVVWTGDYYDNPYLGGPAAFSRQDSAVAFNWGVNAPATGISADNFSVRWGADPYFAAGTYRFYALADDNVRVTVDFALNPQIDTFNTPAVGQMVSADVSLSAGVHHVQVDYREITDNAYVYVTWANLANNPTGPNFPAPPTMPIVSGVWTGQYYTNTALAGSPALVLSETTPSHNWGTGSPNAAIPADNFSARWTSIQTLNGGNYQISASADDGIRVYVDGVPYIDQWHNATGVTYTAVVTLTTGQHNFQVDFYEGTGVAFVEFGLVQVGVTPPPTNPNPPSQAETTGTVVTALRLNVRAAPDIASNVLTKINRSETYPVLGKDADGSWWQLNVNGTVGWVYWRFIDVANPQVVPVVSGTTSPSLDQPTPTGYYANTLATVNVRSGVGTTNAILGQVARGSAVSVVGRNAVNTWWQVNYAGITGWVSAAYAPLQAGTDVNAIPITG